MMGYLSFDFLTVRRLSCLLPVATTRANPQQFAFNYAVVGSFLGLLGACVIVVALLQCIGASSRRCIRQLERADDLECVLSRSNLTRSSTTSLCLATLCQTYTASGFDCLCTGWP
jgi:hypothetical protein